MAGILCWEGYSLARKAQLRQEAQKGSSATHTGDRECVRRLDSLDPELQMFGYRGGDFNALSNQIFRGREAGLNEAPTELGRLER